MGVESIFHVATEFRFDIGHALLSSETLQKSVQGISDAADNAMMSFQHLGAGVVAQLGLGTGGLIGMMLKAIQVSDKFHSSALGFSNVISGNMQFLRGSIDTFNDRLAVSRTILQDISKVANEFSLDEGAMLNMTKMLGPVLVPHGAAGTNFRNAIDLARNVLKASPTLGVDPNEIQGQLIRSMLGQANMHDTLFRRLLSETQAFSELNKSGGRGRNGGGAAAFNMMSFDKRFKMIHDGLNQFASDMDVVNANARTLTGNMTRFKNLLGGINSVLKPIGDAILPPMLELFHQFNNLLNTQVRSTIVSLSKVLGNLASDPKGLLVNFLQLRKLGQDTKSGSHLMETIVIFQLARHVLGFLGVQAAVVLAPLRMLAGGLLSIARMVPWLSVFSFLARAAFFAVSRLLVPMAAAVGLFQIISRARAIAAVNDVKNLLELTPKFAALGQKLAQAFSNLFLPFTMVFDAVAEFIAPLFEVSTWLNFALGPFEFFVDLMGTLGKGMILATATLQGLFFAIFQFLSNIASLKMPFAGVASAFNAGIDDFLERNASRLNDPNGAVVNQVTNIGKVEIRNDFKEQQQPDRIAFTIKEQLMKAAKNPTQGRGGGLQNAFAR